MTRVQYERWSRPFRTPGRQRALNAVNRALTMSCYIAYPLLLAALAWVEDGRLMRAVLVPAVSFGAVSAFRYLYNARRPYEVLDIRPLIHKDKRGKSFPSRHVFSCFVIAMTFLWLVPWLGVVLLAFGAVLAVLRVLGGVHWPRDVAAGAAAGIAAGVIGFWIAA